MNYTPLKEWLWLTHKEMERGFSFVEYDGIRRYYQGAACDWNNCDKHLFIRLPNGRWLDMTRRTPNCIAPWDKEHRCELIWGEAPFFTMNKSGGLTCGMPGKPDEVGLGSIVCTDPYWHGFLRNGNFYQIKD